MINTTLRTAMEITLVSVIVGMSVFDFVVELIDANTNRLGATISEISLHYLYAHPVPSLFLGIILGHLTFPAVQTRPGVATALLVVAFLLMGFAADRFGQIPPMMPVIPLVLGIVCGHFLWPQKVATETGAALLVYQGGTVNLESKNVQQAIAPKR